ncbi:DMT family transporter [Cellulomonas sp. URHE0023]|uniref:DMT family transporter n=1 Tax=Cellulomonas sp. URHE0023 TaxID=1380354 RepID=UPI000482459B|nr:DMT family transporter [Cellulomonas sp. URHE0023]
MTRRGWTLLLAVGVIWGIPYLLIKIAVGEVTPAMVVFVRTAIGALLLLPFALRGGGLRVLHGHWRPLLAFAALEIIGPWILLSNAETTLASSTTGLLIATVPIIAVVLGRLVGDRRPVGAIRWTGLLVGLAGVGLLLGPGAASGGSPWAVAQVLLAAVGYASAPMIADLFLRDVPAIPLTATCLAVTAMFYLPVVLLTGPHAWPTLDAVLALIALGAACTALAFVLFFRLILEVGAARSTLVAYLNPVVAVALGALVLDEAVTIAVVVATALILLGSAAASRRSRPSEPAPRDIEELAVQPEGVPPG